MVRLKANSSSQTIKLNPSSPIGYVGNYCLVSALQDLSQQSYYDIFDSYIDRMLDDGAIIEDPSLNTPYSLVLVNEESKVVRVAATFNSFDTYKGQLELSLNYGFTSSDEDQMFMAYIMSNPISDTITASNYLQYFGYVVYSYKILVTSANTNNPIFWSTHGGNQNYTEYEQQGSDNEFVIL
jgi:hypothetical protein